jgi:hypothetical protein
MTWSKVGRAGQELLREPGFTGEKLCASAAAQTTDKE